ncbi:MAG: hypothetical protein Q7U71_02710, partial [bacterium]|nr:hypothetical protein [bacterium]
VFIAEALSAEFYLNNIVRPDDIVITKNIENNEDLWISIYTLPGIDDSLKLYKAYKIPNTLIKNDFKLKPGKKVTLLKNSKIVGIDKINYFYIKNSEGNGEQFIYFNLVNHDLIDKSNEYLIINLPDTLKHKDDIREILLGKFSIQEQDSLLNKITKHLADNYKTNPVKGFINSIVDTTKHDINYIKKQISDNYYIEHYKSTNNKNKIIILQFMSLNNLKEHFMVILNDSNIYVLPHSIFQQIFTIADEVYISRMGYTPSTGAASIILYKIQNSKLLEIQSDYSFSD